MGAPNSRMQPTALRALTDWDSDVDELIALYENPDAFTNDQIVTSARVKLEFAVPHFAILGACDAVVTGTGRNRLT